MAIPSNRVVSVTLDRNDSFPSRAGFGTQIILTNETKADVLDATTRVVAYSSFDDLANDWDAADETYKAALKAFSQNPAPISVLIGYVNISGASTDADFQDEMDAVTAYNSGFYMINIAKPLRDIAALDGLIAWIEASKHVGLLDSHDPLHKDLNDETNVSARNKGTYERTLVVYNDTDDQHTAVAMAAYAASRNFDQPDTAYTLKFKGLRGVSPANINGAEVQAITGFVPQIGQKPEAGHLANVYISMLGQNFVVEGSMLKPNTFFDEIHASDWIIARTGEAMLARKLNNARIPFTDEGMQILATAPKEVLDVAVEAGLIADFENPETGEIEPAYTITVPEVNGLPEVQRKNRIAPAIAVKFRYAGAIHYSTVNFNMTF